MVLHTRGVIGSGGNSGFQLVNLFAQWRCRRIALVGFDLTDKHGLHWHQRHGSTLNNPSTKLLAKWAARLDAAAPVLQAHGVEVINCSPLSALTAYPKMRLADALAHFKPRREKLP